MLLKFTPEEFPVSESDSL